MKFLHLADLHIGKRVHECSMIEDQKYIFGQIEKIIDNNNIEAVLIAGDVYDKSVPSAEAVLLFDAFLTNLSKRNLKVFIISGNHDSAERIAFGSDIFRKMNVYMSPVYDGNILPATVSDEYGKINIYMLPYIKPIHVKTAFEDAPSDSYNSALKYATDKLNVNTAERNIILSHQFVTGASTCESEEMAVGGLENIDHSVYDKFDYVALGHIHSPQKCKRETLRYSGSPLKYSFSESNHKKYAVVVDVRQKGEIEINEIPLEPLRDMREIKGDYLTLTSRSFYEGTKTDDYLHITLTDETPIPSAADKLRVIYPNLLLVDYENLKSSFIADESKKADVENSSPEDLLKDFFSMQCGKDMSDFQAKFSSEIMEKLTEEMR